MNRLDGWYLKKPSQFKDAVRGWRNIREWAKDTRNRFIQEANIRAGRRSEVFNGGDEEDEELDGTSRIEQNHDLEELSEDELGRLDGPSHNKWEEHQESEDDIPLGSQTKRPKYR
jgi:hypothetical protein